MTLLKKNAILQFVGEYYDDIIKKVVILYFEGLILWLQKKLINNRWIVKKYRNRILIKEWWLNKIIHVKNLLNCSYWNIVNPFGKLIKK